ncbi:unnamed protein product, partial [Tilletia controversa]
MDDLGEAGDFSEGSRNLEGFVGGRYFFFGSGLRRFFSVLVLLFGYGGQLTKVAHQRQSSSGLLRVDKDVIVVVESHHFSSSGILSISIFSGEEPFSLLVLRLSSSFGI